MYPTVAQIWSLQVSRHILVYFCDYDCSIYMLHKCVHYLEVVKLESAYPIEH